MAAQIGMGDRYFDWEHFNFVLIALLGFVCVAAPLGVRRLRCKIEMLPFDCPYGIYKRATRI